MISLWMGLFVTGLLGGAHCIGMCGGFVAAYSSATAAVHPKMSLLDRLRLHGLFQIGRLISYMTIGLVFGGIGVAINTVAGVHAFQSWAGILAGCLMVIFGLALSGHFPALVPLESATSTRIGAKLRGGIVRILRSRSHYKTLPLGILVGFLPCGAIYAVVWAAVAVASPIRGASALLCYGLGTIPALFTFGMVSQSIGERARKAILQLAAALLVIMGAITVTRASGLLNRYQPAHSIADAGRLKIILTVKPEPYRANRPVTIVERISGVGHPVTAQIQLSMPDMPGMMAPPVTLVRRQNNIFYYRSVFTMPGRWQISSEARSGKSYGSVKYRLTVR